MANSSHFCLEFEYFIYVLHITFTKDLHESILKVKFICGYERLRQLCYKR